MAHLIKEKIVLQDVKANLMAEYALIENKLNLAVSGLNGSTEFCISNLADLKEKGSVAWLSNYVESEKERFLSKGFIPKQLRKEIEEQYNRTFSVAEPYFSKVENILNKLENIEVRYSEKSGKFYVDSKDIESLCEKLATYEIPQIYRDYYRELGEFYESWLKIRKWEDVNGISGITDGINIYSPVNPTLPPMSLKLSQIFKDGKFLSMESFCAYTRNGAISQSTTK